MYVKASTALLALASRHGHDCSMAKTYNKYRPERDMSDEYEMKPEIISQIPSDLYGVYLLLHEGTQGSMIVVYVRRGLHPKPVALIARS